MKTFAPVLACLQIACLQTSLCCSLSAQQPQPGPLGQTVSTDGQPAYSSLQRIEQAKARLAQDPKRLQSFNDLAVLYLRRAQETGNDQDLADAEKTIQQGLALEPASFSMQKTQVLWLLAEQRYADAKALATPLNRHTPDDVSLYGSLAEADLALGNYPEAEKSAQWMLNMRANNVPGLLLGARLRVLYGDSEGALDLLNLAYRETSPSEALDAAVIANRIASIDLDTGKPERAEALLERTRQTLPGDVTTLENLARVRLAQHRPDEALTLYRSAAKTSTDPDLLYRQAEAASAAGHSDEARTLLAGFRAAVAAAPARSQAARLDLILLDAGEPATATQAMQLADAEIATRHDVWTLDAYAWALYANGRYDEAQSSLQKAIDVGIQSARIDDQAGHIASKRHHTEEAAKFFELSLRTDPTSPYAADASASLGRNSGSPAPAAAASRLAVPPAAASSVQPGVAAGFSYVPFSTLAPFAPVPVALLIPQATDTDRAIRNAQAKVQSSPGDAQTYALLGATYFQRARETGNVDDYQLSERALGKSLDLVSNDFSADAALGTMAEVCMGEHRFTDALGYAQKALALGSGDVSPFAIVGDAHADMGDYDKARLAYARLTPQEMTLSPRAAYARDSRLSYLKFIAGDTPGAISLMELSVAEGTAARLPEENLAWLHYELGEYFAQAGDAAQADSAYMSALMIHPGDYRALAALGKLRANRGSYAEAITLYKAAIAIVPMPLFVAELGDLYRRSGNQAEAVKQYQLVEYIGLLGSINQVLHNRDLALFYADHDMKLSEALRLAQKEFEVRHDVYTWDALAWALYKNGKIPEAAEASKKARQFGTKDAILFFHAGMIDDRAGDHDRAHREFDQALSINPNFSLVYAPEAKQKNAELSQQAHNASGDGHNVR